MLCCAGCAPAPDDEGAVIAGEPSPATVARARQAADALGAELMDRLVDAVAEGGPVAAIRVCSEVAQSVAASHSSEDLSVRRVSLKARNPADEPDPYERRKLEELERLHAEGRLPEEWVERVAHDGGTAVRYLRPIVVIEACLGCHGTPERIDPEVRGLIEERYPEDRALGYGEGDLRGAISVLVREPDE